MIAFHLLLIEGEWRQTQEDQRWMCELEHGPSWSEAGMMSSRSTEMSGGIQPSYMIRTEFGTVAIYP